MLWGGGKKDSIFLVVGAANLNDDRAIFWRRRKKKISHHHLGLMHFWILNFWILSGSGFQKSDSNKRSYCTWKPWFVNALGGGKKKDWSSQSRALQSWIVIMRFLGRGGKGKSVSNILDSMHCWNQICRLLLKKYFSLCPRMAWSINTT